MRSINLTIMTLAVLFVCALSVDRAQAQSPSVVTIPPIQIPPITVPGTSLPPITLPPIQIPPVTAPSVQVSPLSVPAPTIVLPAGLPPQVQAIVSCINAGGSGLTMAACIAESQGQVMTAQTLRSIDACAGAGGSGVDTAACIAEATGHPNAAEMLRGIGGCLAAGGGDDAIIACIAETMGISMTAEQIQSASACRSSSMSSSSSTSNVSGTSGSSSVSSVSSSSSVQIASCTGTALGEDPAAQALFGCFTSADGADDAHMIACAVGTMSPEQAAVIEGIFACVDGHRQDGDLDAFLTCVLAATGD